MEKKIEPMKNTWIQAADALPFCLLHGSGGGGLDGGRISVNERFNGHGPASEFVYSLDVISWHTVGTPLRNCTGCALEVFCEGLNPPRLFVKPLIEVHGDSLGISKRIVKCYLNLFV